MIIMPCIARLATMCIACIVTVYPQWLLSTIEDNPHNYYYPSNTV